MMSGNPRWETLDDDEAEEVVEGREMITSFDQRIKDVIARFQGKLPSAHAAMLAAQRRIWALAEAEFGKDTDEPPVELFTPAATFNHRRPSTTGRRGGTASGPRSGADTPKKLAQRLRQVAAGVEGGRLLQPELLAELEEMAQAIRAADEG